MAARAQRVCFALAASLGAWLFFSRQPMDARALLAPLGGGASVWTAAQLFFLVALVGGYLLAHLGPRHLGDRAYALAHLSALALALALHDRAPPTALEEGAPALAVLGALARRDGAVALLVAATSPLVQRWHARAFAAQDPYRLAVASNVGSLAALLAYPFVLEPAWGLGVQRRAWDLGIAVLLALLVACARVAWGAAAPRELLPTTGRGWRAVRFEWVLLPMVTTSVTLGATAQGTQDLSPVPFLWTVPLALHLGTFAWAFSGRAPSPQAVAPLTVLVASAVFLVAAAGSSAGPAVLFLSLLAVALVGLSLHARLALRRPPAEALTAFQLALAVGGALGGALNALVAPWVFTRVTEYPLALCLAVALVPSARTTSSLDARLRDVLVPFAVALLALGLRGSGGALLHLGVPWALLLLFSAGRRARLALGFLALLAVRGGDPAVRFETRSFYGTIRVEDRGEFRRMFHGSTLHGVSRTDGVVQPLAYYHPDTPIGALLQALGRERPEATVGVVGLGAGMLAAWAQPSQRWTFYELDPEVLWVARRWFPYLETSRAPVQVLLGDARLALQTHPGRYDLLVLDAFSSDAIPAHLITREGLAVALRALRPGGSLAVHTTHRYLVLEGVLATTAHSLRCRAWVRRGRVRDLPDGPTVTWVLVRPVDDAGREPQVPGWVALEPQGPPWTDDQHALGSVLRWR